MSSRLLVLNNYPLDRLWNEALHHLSPDQLLFGINFFSKAGWDIKLLPNFTTGFLYDLGRIIQWSKFPIPFGCFSQQAAAIYKLNECDLIYSPCQTQTHAISYLRALHLVRRPVVCIAHHPLNIGKLRWLRRPFTRWQLHGTDAFPSLSQSVSEEINAIVPDKFIQVLGSLRSDGPDEILRHSALERQLPDRPQKSSVFEAI
jgi:hypothetical protein